jgi:hypothetical protein
MEARPKYLQLLVLFYSFASLLAGICQPTVAATPTETSLPPTGTNASPVPSATLTETVESNAY